jgi:hypothetical protein
MRDSFPLFIGFSRLENWFKAINPAQPVFADLAVESEHINGTIPSVLEKYTVMVAQPGESDLVYYCRLVVAEETIIMANARGPKHKDRASQALEVVQGWLRDQGLTVHEAVIAAPKDLLFMDGWANFLAVDKKTQQYVRA